MVFLQVLLTQTRIKDKGVIDIRDDQDKLTPMIEIMDQWDDPEDFDDKQQEWNQRFDQDS